MGVLWQVTTDSHVFHLKFLHFYCWAWRLEVAWANQKSQVLSQGIVKFKSKWTISTIPKRKPCATTFRIKHAMFFLCIFVLWFVCFIVFLFFCGDGVFSVLFFLCLSVFAWGAIVSDKKNTSGICVDPPCNVLSCIGCTVGRVLGANVPPCFCMGGYDSKTHGLLCLLDTQVESAPPWSNSMTIGRPVLYRWLSQVFWSQKDKSDKKPRKYQRKTRKKQYVNKNRWQRKIKKKMKKTQRKMGKTQGCLWTWLKVSQVLWSRYRPWWCGDSLSLQVQGVNSGPD